MAAQTKDRSIKHKHANNTFPCLRSSFCLFPCFLPTPEVYLVLPSPLLLLQTVQAVPDIWIHYVQQKLSNKRTSRLHRSLLPFHGETRGSEINPDASLTHVHECRATFTGAGVFTASLAPPPPLRMKKRICLSADEKFLRFVHFSLNSSFLTE